MSFFWKLLYELALDGFSIAMKLPVYFVNFLSSGPNCFQEMILTLTLQVLQRRQQMGRGSYRSSQNSQPVASAGRGGFSWLFSDPSSRVAAAAWSDLEELEESQFRRVPCKKKNG